jgi:hypothetical protein
MKLRRFSEFTQSIWFKTDYLQRIYIENGNKTAL